MLAHSKIADSFQSIIDSVGDRRNRRAKLLALMILSSQTFVTDPVGAAEGVPDLIADLELAVRNFVNNSAIDAPFVTENIAPFKYFKCVEPIPANRPNIYPICTPTADWPYAFKPNVASFNARQFVFGFSNEVKHIFTFLVEMEPQATLGGRPANELYFGKWHVFWDPLHMHEKPCNIYDYKNINGVNASIVIRTEGWCKENKINEKIIGINVSITEQEYNP